MNDTVCFPSIPSVLVNWTNDIQINTQLVPPSTDLLTNLPSGRDIHSPPGPYKLPALDEEELVRMRAPPGDDEIEPGSDMDDSDEEAAVDVRDTDKRAGHESAYY